MVDKVEIVVFGGKGGSGLVGFRREKFVPFGGPDGGDGGDGGSVVVMADSSLTDMNWYRGKNRYKAQGGSQGGGRKKRGKRGDNLILRVPLDTVVLLLEKLKLPREIADLRLDGENVIVAAGGEGGWGNPHFASPTNQMPRIARDGKPGEEHQLVLQLKLSADIGIIGCPNVGKSSLLAHVSGARPEIASYPFTTSKPVLGAIDTDKFRFVLIEMPGIIAGSHCGRGLGNDFLNHIERSKVLIHLLDGSSPDIVSDLNQVDEELARFNPHLIEKPQILVVNKVDLPEVQARSDEIEKVLLRQGNPIFFISVVTGEGIAELLSNVTRLVTSIKDNEDKQPKPLKVFRPQPKGEKGSRASR